jgi:hypothetical protein
MDRHLQQLRRAHLEGDPLATLRYYQTLLRSGSFDRLAWQEQLSIGQVLLDHDYFPTIPQTQEFRRVEIEWIAGITNYNEIYTLELRFQYGQHPSFTICGNTASPLPYNEALEYAQEYWTSFFEESPEELDALNDRFDENFDADEAATFVRETDGELHGFDDSLIPDEIYLQPEDEISYIFQSGSCGQHRAEVEHPLIPEELLDYVMEAWDKYHLKPVNVIVPNYPQDREAILRQGIEILMS